VKPGRKLRRRPATAAQLRQRAAYAYTGTNTDWYEYIIQICKSTTSRCLNISEPKRHIAPPKMSEGHHKNRDWYRLLVNAHPRVLSNFVRYFACSTLSDRSSSLGVGKGSGTVTAFTFRKSVHSRRVPSDFGTRTIGKLKDSRSPLLCPVPANYPALSSKSRYSQGADDMVNNELAVCQEVTRYGVHQGWFTPGCQKIRPLVQPVPTRTGLARYHRVSRRLIRNNLV